MNKSLRLSCVFAVLALVLASVALADNGQNHQSPQARPISLGTSGGNVNDRSNAFCCSGTLGSLVSDAGGQYILSNNHVLARVNKGSAGEAVDQPGLVDVGCADRSSDYVANLSRFVSIDFNRNANNRVDCAIAKCISGDVTTTGDILDIGQPSTTPKTATVNLLIEKSGRTTGFSTGKVTGINASVGVQYQLGCGSGAKKVANYTGQVVTTNISGGGDSGSLIVTQGSCPQPVALLFAGSSSSTIGNPIGEVYSALGVTPVGQNCGIASAIENVDFAVQHAIDVQNRVTPDLLDVPGIAGTAVGADATGRPVIQVFLERDEPGLRARIPAQFEDIASEIQVTGPFVAY